MGDLSRGLSTSPPGQEEDLRWMQMAFGEALRAEEDGEVPVGAVIVVGGRVMGRGHNRTEALQDPTAHAEMLAITAAANTMGSWRLERTSLYVTLEPCLMCAGSIFLARVERLVFAARDPKRGVLRSIMDVSEFEALNHHTEVEEGPMNQECSQLLRTFFEKLRKDSGAS